MIEVVEVDGFPVRLRGDTHVTLVRGGDLSAAPEEVLAHEVVEAGGDVLLVLQSEQRLDVPGASPDLVRRLEPVLPVPTRANLAVPFLHAGELAEQHDLRAAPLSDFALEYECARSGFSESEVLAAMDRLRGIMREGIEGGLAGTQASDRLLPQQSGGFAAALAGGGLHDAGLLNRCILYVTALMETKRGSMGTIVAAPTTGSCATFPATCLAAAEACGASDERTLRAMLAAGSRRGLRDDALVFAAEVGGCQAETGAGAAMAAAALVELQGGSAERALSAASQALQNVLGLVCDPVGNRVEAPCLGRNVTGAANAIASANMALAGYDHLIPLDEVLDAHRAVSASMARELPLHRAGRAVRRAHEQGPGGASGGLRGRGLRVLLRSGTLEPGARIAQKGILVRLLLALSCVLPVLCPIAAEPALRRRGGPAGQCSGGASGVRRRPGWGRAPGPGHGLQHARRGARGARARRLRSPRGPHHGGCGGPRRVRRGPRRRR